MSGKSNDDSLSIFMGEYLDGWVVFINEMRLDELDCQRGLSDTTASDDDEFVLLDEVSFGSHFKSKLNERASNPGSLKELLNYRSSFCLLQGQSVVKVATCRTTTMTRRGGRRMKNGK